MSDDVYRGVLTGPEGHSFLLDKSGTRVLEDEILWSGYIKHWSERNVCARRLPQNDYETGRPIVVLWPDEPLPARPFVELYFNERLIKYPASYLGHLAINVDNNIFNFSHKINENEVLRHEEYFYRPALGEFAPDPFTGRDNADNPQKPYYDKFGRLFMRTIHVLRITGLETVKFSRFCHNELASILATPPDPRRPGYYRNFNPFTRNCVTVIRDGFHDLGYKNISGIFPRDLFIRVLYFFAKQSTDSRIGISRFTLPQLSVPEALPSVMPPFINPLNRCRDYRLRHA